MFKKTWGCETFSFQIFTRKTSRAQIKRDIKIIFVGKYKIAC